MQDRRVEDLIRIAAAGGGFLPNARTRTTDELIRIASAGSANGARITFSGMQSRPIDDLVRIAGAGAGCVSFEV
jgi:hypothetical protein